VFHSPETHPAHGSGAGQGMGKEDGRRKKTVVLLQYLRPPGYGPAERVEKEGSPDAAHGKRDRRLNSYGAPGF